MKDYVVVVESSLNPLVSRVKAMLLVGWIPVGPAQVLNDNGHLVYVQTMVLPFDAEGFK